MNSQANNERAVLSLHLCTSNHRSRIKHFQLHHVELILYIKSLPHERHNLRQSRRYTTTLPQFNPASHSPPMKTHAR